MTNKKIFIVDSDPVFRAKLGIYLNKLDGVEVVTFLSGEDCLRFMNLEPDILIVDYHMESQHKDVLSGLDLLKVISREHPAAKVIMLSPFNNYNEDMNVASYGAFDYIPKSQDNIYRVENTVLNAFKYNTLEEDIKLDRSSLYVAVGCVFLGMAAVGAFMLTQVLHYSHVL